MLFLLEELQVFGPRRFEIKIYALKPFFKIFYSDCIYKQLESLDSENDFPKFVRKLSEARKNFAKVKFLFKNIASN